MEKLLKRLNADIRDHREAMMMYARYFGLPYVEQDLIELMEFWANEPKQIVTITLVTDNKEVHRHSLNLDGSTMLYSEVVAIFCG